MYKLIGMDFDGTLLNRQGLVSSKSHDALLKYRNEDYLIVGVTGRNLESVKWDLSISYFDYIILTNGSSIYDVKNDKLEPIKTIPFSLIKDLTDFLTPYCSRIDYVTDMAYYLKGDKKHTHVPFLIDIHSLDEIKGNISKINVFLKDDQKVEEIFPLLAPYSKKLNIFIMDDNTDDCKIIAINPLNINKGVSLEYLGKKLGISLDEMIFFGDGTNDLEALEMVGMGVAMENALDIVKAKADAVTLSNDADGIAYFLEQKLGRHK